jgi:nucleoside-diphosphate-sugar epimerase
MKVLITGAGGFIGRFLSEALIKRQVEIRGLFLPDEDSTYAEKIGIEIYRGDITQADTLKGLTGDVHTVYHLAARTSDWGTRKQFEEVMVTGTKNLLAESAGHIKRFVYVSSIAALGFNRDMVGLNEDSPRMETGIPYCDTKIIAEDIVTQYCRENRMEYTIIRPANVIGPGSVWVRETLDAFFRGPVPLVNGGKAPGAFVYVKNLVEGMILAAESEQANGKIYHFRDDYPITWGEYLNTLGSWIGKKTLGSIPYNLAWHLGVLFEKALTPFGVRPPITRLAVGATGKNNDVDCTRARTELAWISQVSQIQAIGEIREWVQQHYQVPEKNKIKDFHNKTVYITGGSSGIGLATAKLLSQKGAHLVLIARDTKKLELARKQVKACRRSNLQQIVALSLDVADVRAVKEKLVPLVDNAGGPDILINSAGILVSDYFENISDQVFDDVMKINVYGVRNMIATLLPYMKALKKGHIVNLSSSAGLFGVFGYTSYCASKYALIGFSESLRTEIKKYNIAMTVVCPPNVLTPMNEKEALTIPPETRVLKKMAGSLTPQYVAKKVVKGIQKRQYFVIPGIKIKMLYLTQRFSPGFIARAVTDFVVTRA